MSRLCHLLTQACWGLGMVSLVLAVITKLSMSLMDKLNTEPRGVLALAAVFFLGAIASDVAGRPASASH